jgi:hypothetical protein
MPLFDTHPLAHPCIPSQLPNPNGRSAFLTRSTATFSDEQEVPPPLQPLRQLVRSWSYYVTLWDMTLTHSQKSSQNNPLRPSQVPVPMRGLRDRQLASSVS